jgi:anti-sigma B factor antagonist
MALVSPDDTVRELFARYRRGGLDAALELLDDDVVLLLLAVDCDRVLRGTEELRGHLAELREGGVELDPRLDTLERRGDAVVASCTVRRERPDGFAESQQHWVFHLVGSRLRRLSTYASRDEALSSVAALNALGPATSFDVDERRGGGAERVVRPTGELDLATAPALERVLLDGRVTGDVVVLDLADLEFLDSTGLRVIVRAAEAARRDGWELRLRPARPEVQRIFDLTGILEALPFETD